MATAVTIKPSDRFPIGTKVAAFAPAYNDHFEGRPSGTAVEEATVDAAGKLAFTTLEGNYVLWASVGGKDVTMRLGDTPYVELGTLFERLAAKRAEVGA